MDPLNVAELQQAGLWVKLLLAVLAAGVALTVGRAGARLARWVAGLTPDTRDDPLWRAVAWVWWGAVLLGAVSFGHFLFDQRTEPLYSWGRLLAQWVGSRGLAVLFVLAATYFAYRLVEVLVRRIRLPRRAEFEREQVRVQTLMAVIESTLKGVVIAVGVLLALSNMGLNVGALIAGAGIAGLAVSFAAQNLVRDVINGFFILLEDQYGVGDVVRVGDLAGGVERMNLRLTVLRDLEGNLHFVPHGQVDTVTVMSHGWARALVDVGVAYGADVDRALTVIEDEAQRFYDDPEWRGKFTEERPQVLGVNELGDSAVVIRVLFTVQAKQQWAVGREFRRRVKKRLDAEGIEIPFPQRTVWLRQGSGA